MNVTSSWNLFGLDLDVVVKFLRISSNPEGLEEKLLQEVDMRLMWIGAAFVLFGTIGYTIGSRPREDRKIRIRNRFRTRFVIVQKLDNAVHGCTSYKRTRDRSSIFLTRLIFYTITVVEMYPSSEFFIDGGTVSSAQGNFQIRIRDSESGTHDFRSVQNSILIDDP